MKNDNAERFNRGKLRNIRFHNRTRVAEDAPVIPPKKKYEGPHGGPLAQLRRQQKKILDDSRNYFVNGNSEETNV